jgi:hypothetical protein
MIVASWAKKTAAKSSFQPWAEKQEAERAAGSAPGMTKVENYIAIAP